MLVLLLLGCPEPEPEVDLAADLTSPGPYGVGYRDAEIVTTDVDGAERTLRVALWVPTNDTTGAEVRYQGLFPAPGVLGGAATAEGSFPLAVFSHGHQGFAENSGFLMAHLASHGWLVAAPDHTGNTTWDGSDRETAIYLQRPLDVSAVLDHVLATEPVSGPVVAVGHSFGGYTTFALAGASYDEAAISACETASSSFCSTMTPAYADRLRDGFADARIDAAIAMAPGDYGLFGADGLASVGVPVLLMTGELDPAVGDDAQPYWDAIAGGGDLWVELVGGGHQTFTDFSGEIEDLEGLIAPDEGFRIVDAYALAWARLAAGDESVRPVLDGEVAISTAARLER